MKHTLKYLIIPSAFFLAACSGANKSEQKDTATIGDTIEILTQEETEATQDSVPAYLSEDLQRFGLHGQVKSVKTKDYASFVTCLSETLNFNEEGVLTTAFTNYTDNETSINANGFIDATSCRESDGTTFEFTYTNFDEAGNPISGEYVSEGPDGRWKANFSIVYEQFDRENNWVKRIFKGESSSTQMDANGDYGREDKENFSVTETRVITYY